MFAVHREASGTSLQWPLYREASGQCSLYREAIVYDALYVCLMYSAGVSNHCLDETTDFGYGIGQPCIFIRLMKVGDHNSHVTLL